jgi:hypothetical protein
MWTRQAARVVLTMLALSSAVAWAGDGPKSAPEKPDAGFLEFLGSVDRLAETNPDYLAQAGGPAPASPPAKRVATAVTPPPPPASASGVKNNDE